MTDELKSMIKKGEMTFDEIEDKEKYEAELFRKREFNRKQSKNN
jgi:hypothetical protein